jgi:hypothetical protein
MVNYLVFWDPMELERQHLYNNSLDCTQPLAVML